MDPFDAKIMGAVDATVAACRAEVATLRARVAELEATVASWKVGVESANRLTQRFAAERDAALADWKVATEYNAKVDGHAMQAFRERDAALARVGVLEKAARALVERLDFVHAHPNYQGVWMMAGIHSYPYTGPTYIDELAALKAALSSPPPHDGEGGYPDGYAEKSRHDFDPGIEGTVGGLCGYCGLPESSHVATLRGGGNE